MKLRDIAKEYGFTNALVLQSNRFIHYEQRQKSGTLHKGGMRLCTGIHMLYPHANAIIALIWLYDAFDDSVPLCSNYIPAHAAYQAAGHLLTKLNELGIIASRVHVPIRELLLRSGCGIALKNGLTALPDYGTRFTIQTLAVELPNPVYDDAEPLGACIGCDACIRACPVSAISGDGLDYSKCLRAYMGNEPLPEWVMNKMTKMLGCEVCQGCCPYNANQNIINELPSAFSLDRLLHGDTVYAINLIGANQTSDKRLMAHAAVIAARYERNDLLPALQAMSENSNRMMQEAAQYAISQLHNSK
jgi:ferredoxin